MSQQKAMLACDWDADKIRFPVVLLPKIDGVRGINFDGTLRGRSLKTHKNRYLTEFFSRPEFIGLDGELVVGPLTSPTLCRDTSSACSTIVGSPNIGWCVFDYVTEQNAHCGYLARYGMLREHIEALRRHGVIRADWLYLVPIHICNNLEEVLKWEDHYLTMGYEGVILRDPETPYKRGRATVREGGYLRIKRFIEEEARVVSIAEGETNNNEAQLDERGMQFRSSHKENKTPNGQLGSMECSLLKDVFDPVTKQLLFKAGDIVTVSPGSMTHEERTNYWQNPHLIVNHTIKFKFFPKGVKDKPRFPNYVCHRDSVDM